MLKPYCQGYISEKLQKFTASYILRALYEWLRISVILENALSTFESSIHKCLTGSRITAFIAYADYISCFRKKIQRVVSKCA